MSFTKQHFNDHMNELLQTIAKLQQESKLFRLENRLLKSKLVEVKTTALCSELYSRRNNLVIHSLEFLEGQDFQLAILPTLKLSAKCCDCLLKFITKS